MTIINETKFALFRGVNKETLARIRSASIKKDNLYKGAIVTEGEKGEILLVTGGSIGIIPLFFQPPPPYGTITKPYLDSLKTLPIIRIYSQDECVVELFLTRNPNIYAEAVEDNTSVVCIEHNTFAYLLQNDHMLLINFLSVCQDAMSFILMKQCILQLLSKDRIKILKAFLRKNYDHTTVGRFCHATRETVTRSRIFATKKKF